MLEWQTFQSKKPDLVSSDDRISWNSYQFDLATWQEDRKLSILIDINLLLKSNDIRVKPSTVELMTNWLSTMKS